MRLVGAGSLVYLLAITFAVSGAADTNRQPASPPADLSRDTHPRGEDRRGDLVREGRQIFRFDTFGDEQLWTDVLRMHEVLPAVDPTTALAVGLKVDVTNHDEVRRLVADTETAIGSLSILINSAAVPTTSCSSIPSPRTGSA